MAPGTGVTVDKQNGARGPASAVSWSVRPRNPCPLHKDEIVLRKVTFRLL